MKRFENDIIEEKYLRHRNSLERHLLNQRLRDVRSSDRLSAGLTEYTPSRKTIRGGVTTNAKSGWRFVGRQAAYRRVFTYTRLGRQFLDSIVDKPCRVLDVGAGIGEYWNPVLARNVHLRVVAQNPSYILSPAAAGLPIEQWIGAIETRRLLENSFDAILSVYGGFDKTDFPATVLDKLSHALKRDGLLYLVCGRTQLGHDDDGNPILLPAKDTPKNNRFLLQQISLLVGTNFSVTCRLGGSYRKDILIQKI